jgi:hypothetical protein
MMDSQYSPAAWVREVIDCRVFFVWWGEDACELRIFLELVEPIVEVIDCRDSCMLGGEKASFELRILLLLPPLIADAFRRPH